ncbi:MAG: CBS domain-containing protein [Candidatus Micrarchaeota archaeon]
MNSKIVASDLVSQNFISAKGSDFLSQLAGVFLKKNQNHALVFDESGVYLGATTKDFLLKKHTDFAGVKLKSVVKSTPVLYADDSLVNIAGLMFSSEARVLPVFEGKKLLGAVFASDVIRQVERLDSAGSLHVSDVASFPSTIILETASVEQAISLMREKKVNRLPLVSSSGKLTGLFSFSDLMKNVALHEHTRPRGKGSESARSADSGVLQSPIKSFASSEPFVCQPNDSMSAVLSKMGKNGVSSLVVVDQLSKPSGIITTRDLLKLLVNSKETKRNISFVDKPALDEIDGAVLDKTVADFFDKMSVRFSSELLLTVHFKKELAKGTHQIHDVHCHMNGPGLKLSSSAQNWKLLSAVQDALKALQSEVRKKKR